MCLLAFAWQHHPRYALIFAGNRDEFHDRPARPAGWWPELPALLAGQDRQAGGTWLGVSRAGRFAVVTNFREGSGAIEGAPSRGNLVTDFIDAGTSAEGFLARLRARADQYAGFNLLFGEPANGSLHYFSNRGGRGAAVTPGLHGLSNHFLDTPWPKLTRTVAGLDGLLAREVIEPDDLLPLLTDPTRPTEEALPDTGVPRHIEALLSAPFIVSPDYGTRCSTVVLVTRSGQVRFRETRFDAGGRPVGETDVRFEVNAAEPARSITG